MMQEIEWMNRAAQDAKRRGDYISFEYWRLAYLNAQAEIMALDNEREKEYNEGG